MRQILNSKECVGKVVERITTEGDFAAVLFADGKAMVLFASGDGGGGADINCESPAWCERNLLPNYMTAFTLGLITQAERDALRIPDEERRRAEIEKRERAELARLQTKYGKDAT